jgi:hypothetical protein
MATSKVSIDDLLLAADWCEEYEAHPDGFGQEQVEAMERVALLLREIAQAKGAAEMAKVLSDRSGRKITSPDVKAAARAWAREHYPTHKPETPKS